MRTPHPAPITAPTLLAAYERPRRRPTRRIVGAVAAVTAVALAAGVTLAGGTESAASRYRTAIVGLEAVDESLYEVATVEPVSQAAVAFPVSGTVATVEVAVGDQVGVASTLATLDTTSLEAAVHEAQAELDQAELTLERALNGEDVGGAGGGQLDAQGTFTGASASSTGTVTIELLSTAQAPDDALRDAQQAVLDAQRQVDEDLRAAEEALASAQEICAALGENTGEPAEEPTPSSDDISACQQALESVLAAQQAVQASQTSLAEAASALDELLLERAAAEDETTTPPPFETTGSAPTGGGTTSSPPDAEATTTSSSPSSEDLIAYQKAVDAAAVQVAVAEQAVRQATILSPIAGTVASVDIAPGDDVTAGSTTANITIVGDGGYEVTTTVSVDDLPDIEVGQAATITPDGTSDAIDGEIINIGVIGSSDTGTTTYPVTIGITGDSTALRNGSVASVTVVTDNATRALAVPTSAVHADNGGHTVTVLDGTTAEEQTVEVGAIGATWTEITEGLEAGQTVVLADLDEPLPGSATDSETTAVQGGRPQFGGRGGAFPGGGPP